MPNERVATGPRRAPADPPQVPRGGALRSAGLAARPDPGLPPALAALFMRLLAKRAEDRRQTAVEVLRVLDAAAGSAASALRALLSRLADR